MNAQLNRPEKIAYRILVAIERLDEAKFLSRNAGRDDIAERVLEEISRLKALHDLVVSAGEDTQTFARREAA